MHLSLIIVNYNREKYIDAWLSTWYSYPRNFEYEILIMDNGSRKDVFKTFFKKWSEKKEIRFIELARNTGFGHANNEGVKVARGDYIAIANPDTKVFENGTEPLIKFLEDHPDVGVVAPQEIGAESGKIIDSYRRFMRPLDFLVKRLKFLHKFRVFRNYVSHFLMWGMDHNEIQTVDWLRGSSMMMRRKDFLDIGGFDKRYFIFVEDMDLCRKFWVRGQKVVYYPKVQWQHSEKRATSSGSIFKDLLTKLSWWHLSSIIKYFVKWGFRSVQIDHRFY